MGRFIRSAAIAAPLIAGACTGGSNEASPPSITASRAPITTERFKPTTTLPPTTTTTSFPPSENREFNIAAEAAWQARVEDNYQAAEKLVDQITSPEVRQAAEHAVDAAEAENAVWIAWKENEIAKANEIIALIEDPALKRRALDGLDKANREEALWNQTPRNVSEWNDAETEVVSKWYDLKTDSLIEWNELYMKTDDYKATTTNTSASSSSLPIK